MNAPTRHANLALVTALLFVVTGCLCKDPVTGDRYFCFGEATEAEEIALGKQYAPSFIAESGGVYPEPEVHAYLEKRVMELARVSHRPNLPWEFHILNTSQINAFALPGGQVFVTRGLLSTLDSEAQFMHLMGHEIGHVAHRHAYRGQGRAALLGIFTGIVAIVERNSIASPDDPLLIAPAVAGIGQLTSLKFSRDQELESDARGVDYAIKAGYDPREGKKTFETFLELKEASGQEESLVSGLFSTHPLDSTRIAKIDHYIDSEYPDLPQDLEISKSAWSLVSNEIRTQEPYYRKHDEALSLIGEARESNDSAKLARARSLLQEGASALPDHAPFWAGLGVIALAENDLTLARDQFSRATSLDSSHFLGQLYLGVTEQRSNNWTAAIPAYRAAHELHPTHPMPCYFLGEVYEGLGNDAEAKDWYRLALERSPKGSEMRTRAREKVEAAPAA